jgi:hypothetical protein
MRLSWHVICKLAVKACIAGTSLADLMEQAIADMVSFYDREKALQAHIEAHPELTLEDVADLAEANGMTARITLEKQR